MSIVADDTSTGLSDNAAVEALIEQMKTTPKAPEGQNDDDADLDDEDEGDDDEANDQVDEDGEDADPEDADLEDEEDGEGEGDEGEEEQQQAAPNAINDDTTVKVTVNGEETEVSIGSLKRLAGQEASLTRKSQEADQVGGRAAFMIQNAIQAIQEDLAPYEDIDWLVAQQEMDPEEFKWHRDNFTRSKQRFDNLVGQAGEFEQAIQARQQAARGEAARAATAELTRDVPGWNDSLYTEVMQYGVAQGLDPDDVANITSAPVIKILLKAMKADKAGTVTANKVKAAPTRVRRPSSADETTGNPSTRQMKALEAKVRSGRGSDDDAVALLMGRWRAK